MARAEPERLDEEPICPRCGLRKWTRELEQKGIIIRFCDECYWGRQEEPAPERREQRDPAMGSV